MSRRKIVIKINYNPSESNNTSEPINETTDFSEWNVKRILVALFVLVVVSFLIYFWFLGSTTQDSQNFVATSRNSVKLESLDTSEQLSHSDSHDRKQKNAPKNEDIRNDQDLVLQSQDVPSDAKDLAKHQGKLVEHESGARDRKKWVESLKIKRSQFTSNIKDKEPVDNLTSPFFALRDKAYSIYFFTELKRLKGSTVTHVWKHKGQVKSNKEFEVRGNRWRVYTSKLLNMSMLGQWDVLVVDSSGRILAQRSFELKAPLER